MADKKILQKLAMTPVTKLNIGDVRLRRRLKTAGFKSVIDLFALTADELDRALGVDDADAVLDLKEDYERDREGFAHRALSANEAKAKAKAPTQAPDPVSGHAATPNRGHAPSKKKAPAARPRVSYAMASVPVPDTEFAAALGRFQAKAATELDQLCDHDADAMVYQAFGEFATDLDELAGAFSELFGHYAANPRRALELIETEFPDAFLVYVADRARLTFDGKNLWTRFCGSLGIDGANVQAVFKGVFVDRLVNRGMPVYGKDEQANYYFYTALLHGGLSTSSWETLWRDSLLPMARDLAKGLLADADMDGLSILEAIRSGEKYAPGKTVLNILEKAPDATVAPLLEAGFAVASQVHRAGNPASEFTMLTSCGLPDVAMQALRATSERPKAGRKGAASAGSRLVYLPSASLQLDPGEGRVVMRWSRQQFPKHFADCRVDYLLDGEIACSRPFEIGVGKCILDAVELPVAPQSRYAVEIRLMRPSAETGEMEVAGVLEQSFRRSRPGCFEFVRDSSGSYRLRGSNERIARLRRVAFIVKDGYAVRPVAGMKAISESDGGEAWEDAQVLFFDVEPGAAGSLVDLSSGEEVASWKENYSSSIDKSGVIGKTAEGLDLYGYAPNDIGTNAALPKMHVRADGGGAVLGDLDIECTCDGQAISLDRKVLGEAEGGSGKPLTVAIDPSKTALIPWHVQRCEVIVRQLSAGGTAVFRYRFAVAPIQGFRLAEASADMGPAVATYRFEARLPLYVTDSQGQVTRVAARCGYDAKTLLSDEALSIKLESDDGSKVTDAVLALAAIDVRVPTRLAEISAERPLCLADALALGPETGVISISSSGRRHRRSAYVSLGKVNLRAFNLSSPGAHSFNLFSHPKYFLPEEGEPEEMPVVLHVRYGDGAPVRPWTDLEILRCREGLGFTGCRLLMKAAGGHVAKLDSPLACDAHVVFTRRRRILGEADVSKGTAEVPVPAKALERLDARKSVTLVIAPTSLFGGPQYDYAVTFDLERS